MKIKIFLSVIVALTFIFAVSALADDGSVKLIPYDNFESYSGRTGSPWSGQGAASSVLVEQTDRGKSAVLLSYANAMQELFVDVTATEPDVKAVITGFSLKLCDLKVRRAYYLRCDSAEFCVMEISQNGELIVGGTTIGRITVGKWYDFVVEYNMEDGFVRVKIADGSNCSVAEGTNETKGIRGIWRIDFVSGGSDDGDAVCYLDNCWSYGLKYNVSAFSQGGDIIKFEDFVPSPDGQAAPPDWIFLNKAPGATSAGTAEFDGYGKTLELTSAGTTHYQVICGFSGKSDDEIIVEFDFRMKPSSYVNFGLRGTNSSGGLTRDNFPIVLSSSSNLTMSESAVGTLLPDEWYHVTLTLNIPSQLYTASFVSDGNSVQGSGTIPGDIRTLKGVDFYFPVGAGGNSCIYLDNINVHSKGASQVKGFLPVAGKISKGEATVSMEVDGDFGYEAVENANVKINGDSSSVIRKEINGNEILITFETDEYDSGYFIEIDGLICDDGISLSAANGYFTGDKWTISDFNYTKDSISEGNIGVSANFTSESDELTKATLVLALYNKNDGEMLGITYDVCSVSPGISENLNCSLNVPESDDELELVAYIWDGFDGMKILGMSKILN